MKKEYTIDDMIDELEELVSNSKLPEGIIYGIIFDDEQMYLNNYSRASFTLRKDDLKDFIYIDKLDTCKPGYENYYLNRIYKFMWMENNCAIFYRNF